MPERVVAKYGPGQGPWALVGSLKTPRLAASGQVNPGEKVITEYTDNPKQGAEARYEHSALDDFLVFGTRYSRVIYEGTNQHLLIAFVGG